MRKAVFVINSLQNGGAERVVATQASCLSRAGVDVTVICFRKWVQYQLEPSVHTIFLTEEKKSSLLFYIRNLIPLVRRLNRELDRLTGEGETVLMTSNLLFPDAVVRLSRYRGRVISVLHAHQDILPGFRSLPYRLLIRWLYGGRQLICVGDGIEEEIRHVYGLRQKTVRTIWNPIDLNTLREKMEEPLDFSGPFLLFCGRLTRVKRPERAIAAFFTGGLYRKYSLVFLGEGELAGELKALAEKYGIASRVHLMGWEPNVYKWMNRASLLVLSSESEGFSMVLAEALSCGCPVVSVRSRGPEQIMTGRLERYLCGPSPKELAAAMKEALESYPGGLEQYAKRCAAEAVMERYLTAYRKWNKGGS